jgi:ABC-type hemin transport system ATPase subunit
VPGAERFDRLDFMISIQLGLSNVRYDSSKCNDRDYVTPTMSQNGQAGLFKRIVGYLAGWSPERSTPQTVESQARNAWMRTDALLQYENEDFESLDPQHQASALRALDDFVQFKQNQDVDFVSCLIPASDFHH